MSGNHRIAFRAWSVLVVLLMPVVVGAAPVLGQYRDPVMESVTVESRSTSFIAPAIGERPDGSLVGVGMEVEATIRSGTGGVFLDTRPLTQLDMQGSARLAATMAASVSGKDFTQHDFVLKVRSPTTAVGGPSAGGGMAVAYTALLLDVPLREDVMMTGMINPDGSIGPVGGIIQKAEAAHNEGARTFLIPEGQGVVRHVQRIVDGDGPFPEVREEETRLDVAEYAMQEWGLRVHEVSDLHEAFRYKTDHELERPQVPEATRSPVFDQVMGEAADGQLVEADERHARVRAGLDESGLADSDPLIFSELSELMERAGNRLDRAHDAMDAGVAYTASSRAFQASVEISRVELWIAILANEEPFERLEALTMAVGDRVERAMDNASAAPIEGLVLLEVVGAAQVRAAEAGRLVERSQVAQEQGEAAQAVEALAFARERERSVAWWLSMADAIEARVELTPLEAEPRDLAREYRQVAREAGTYADVLGGQIGGGEAQARLLDLARVSLRDSQQAQESGLHAGSLYLAVESQVAAHAALSIMGSEALIPDRLDRQRDAALVAVEDARRLGLEPFLAASFQEFAQALEGEDAVSALLLYGNAAMIATLSAALGGGERQIFGIGPGLQEPPLVTRVGGLGPDPWTGYFALATIVFGFMAGILVTLIVVQARTPRPQDEPRPVQKATRSRRGAAFPPGPLHPHHNGSHHAHPMGRSRVAVPPEVVRVERRGTGGISRMTPRGGLK